MTRRCGQTLAAQLRTDGLLQFGSQHRKRTVFLVGDADSRDSHPIARKTCRNQWSVQCFRTETCPSKKSPSRSEGYS